MLAGYGSFRRPSRTVRLKRNHSRCTAFGLALNLTGVAESQGVSPPALTRAVRQPRKRSSDSGANTNPNGEMTLPNWHSAQ
jgi:hypothetical protein